MVYVFPIFDYFTLFLFHILKHKYVAKSHESTLISNYKLYMEMLVISLLFQYGNIIYIWINLTYTKMFFQSSATVAVAVNWYYVGITWINLVHYNRSDRITEYFMTLTTRDVDVIHRANEPLNGARSI